MGRGPNESAASAGEPPAMDGVQDAVRKLQSFHEGDIGFVETVAYGRLAIPALRAILLAREPSGLYETRRRAVEALARLHADDILIEFLNAPLDTTDPVEQTGEEAVINAAARALAESADSRVTPLLLELAERAPLAGIVEALGKRRCVDALPYFIKALAEDFTRPAAEAALRNLGPAARAALLETATRAASDPPETVSSKRQRRSAFGLFLELGPPAQEEWPAIRRLMADSDARIAELACETCLAGADEAAKVAALLRLVDLLSSVDWLLEEKIEDCLVKHFDIAQTIVRDVLEHDAAGADFDSPRAHTMRALHRVTVRAQSGAHRSGD